VWDIFEGMWADIIHADRVEVRRLVGYDRLTFVRRGAGRVSELASV
jgi:hypothetical protein